MFLTSTVLLLLLYNSVYFVKSLRPTYNFKCMLYKRTRLESVYSSVAFYRDILSLNAFSFHSVDRLQRNQLFTNKVTCLIPKPDELLLRF